MASEEYTTYKYSTNSPTGRAEDDPTMAYRTEGGPASNRWYHIDWEKSKAWANAVDHRPEVTIHAQERWDERTPSWSRSPEYAYDHGAEVEELKMAAFEDKNGRTPERVRVFAEAQGGEEYVAAMLIVDGCMVTVYRAESEPLSRPAQAHLQTLAARYEVS